jgi:glycosyltransferase involved in cell wall biosynthesis
MVNQYQLLEFVRGQQMDIYCTESEYFNGGWTREAVGSGFNADEAAQLQSIPTYQGQAVDAIYRIHTPNTLALADVPVITFLVTEFGLDDKCFTPCADIKANIKAYVDAGHRVVTPSGWSRQRIIDYGFDPQCVFVVPHGVDAQRFKPMAPEERASNRAALGYGDQDVVFLNVGAPLWNKGLDVVLEAYFLARQRNKNIRLMIKDQQALYGMTAVKMIQAMVAEGRIAADEDSINAISVIPKTLTLDQLRSLYAVSDYYLSPYRAEGFNLPVIESIACGTPVIVTQGGSTDDFCDANTSIKIPSTFESNFVYGGHAIGACLMPNRDALVEILCRCAQTRVIDAPRMHFGRADLLERFNWKRAANLITALV